MLSKKKSVSQQIVQVGLEEKCKFIEWRQGY